MKIVRVFLLVSVALCLGACHTKEKKLRDEVTAFQIAALRHLASVANGIDFDAVSLISYERADSLLSRAESASNVYESETFINAALTEIWYGMSYSRALYACQITLGDEEPYLMEYLDDVLEEPIAGAADSLEALAMQDINAVYAILNGYLLSNPEVYVELIEGYAQYHYAAAVLCEMDSLTSEQTYRLLRLNTRNACFNALAPLVIDTYSVLHADNESLCDDYLDSVIALGGEMDAIPFAMEKVTQLADTAFWRYNAQCADICARLIEMLAQNIEELRSREMDYRNPIQKVYMEMDEEEKTEL